MSKLARLALIGNPNCGKTALFNLLTGTRQHVANYAGVTVERKIGSLALPNGREVALLDLPGAYSLHPATADEEVTRDVLLGQHNQEPQPDFIIAVVDATNLNMNLRLVLEVKTLGLPMVLALNMMDVARKQGFNIDLARLSESLGMPVIETVAVQRKGHHALLSYLQDYFPVQDTPNTDHAELAAPIEIASIALQDSSVAHLLAVQKEVRRIIAYAAPDAMKFTRFNHKIDAVVMHPIWGLLILAGLLFFIFQAVFSWASLPVDWINAGVDGLSAVLQNHLHDGLLRSLLVDGVIAGMGGVLVFLPQILILFFFILLLEDTGYLPRAAFLLDRVMGKVGLSGRAFIPLLSSFACAIPGIMAARTIPNWRDRLVTIMIAPLMTCSARLPIYALLIGAFIPQRSVAGVFNLQGLTLFVLYLAGVLSAMLVALCLKKFWMKQDYQPLMLELPPYRFPSMRNLGLGLWEKARIFVRRVGTIIFALTVVLWFLATFPKAPLGATGAAIQYSFAGMLGRTLEHVLAPIGFNWQISIALVPGMAAREVAVGALGTVYALSNTDDTANTLAPLIAGQWSIATAYALLAWYVFAPQCLSTLAVVKRETNSWRYPVIMMVYLFVLAYVAAGVTFHLTNWITR